MTLRTVRDVVVLTALALLPALIAGCAAARAQDQAPRAVGQQPTPDAARSPDSTMIRSQEASVPRPGSGWGNGFGGTGFGNGGFGGKYGAYSSPSPRPDQLVPTQSMPSLQEELWVIQKWTVPADGDVGDDVPGSGVLFFPRADKLIPVPLKHTDVKANITGYIGTADVTQQFQNPYDGKIEAVYVFPLPHNAAVNEFVMTVGERRIRGIVREREEAKQIYEQAKGQGYVASLLEQDRPNVFAQKVANIEPGKRIDVSVRYFHTLSYADGWYEWAFPMVVGPRFNPPGTANGVGATSRGAIGASKQKTEVQYLRPDERSGHDIAVAVTLDALVPVEAIECRTHQVTVKRESAQRFQVALEEGDRIPNRDLVLRWKVAGEGIKSGLIVQRDKDGHGGYFAMMLVPPADLGRLPRSPVEMVFTLDVSGSMAGRPIEQAKSAVRWALAHLRPDDTLQVVRFAAGAEQMAERPVPATPENVRRAMRYLDSTSAGGGTMMLEGLRKALVAPADESRPRYVVFLTDGFIGNEAEILGALQRSLCANRVFSIGVGSGPNRYLLEHMAKLGRGAVAFLGLRDSAEDVMASYFGAISHPAMTDLSLEWGDARVADVYPNRLPDLFVGRAVTVVGRFEGKAPEHVKVRGHVRGEMQALEVAISDGPGAEPAGLAAVWARMKIGDLGDRLALEPRDSEVPVVVRQVALEHGLTSAYTSFVAVDALTRTAGDHGTTVAAPVPIPEGVRYETTVTER